MSEPSPNPSPPKARRHPLARAGLVALAVTAFTALIVTFGTLALTGRTLPLPDSLTARIEARVNHRLDGPSVSIGQLVLFVNRDFIPRVTARNVAVRDASGGEVARLNSLRAVMTREGAIDAAMGGRLAPDVLRLSGAQITLRRRVDGSFALEFGGSGSTAIDPRDLLAAIDAAFDAPALAAITRVEAENVTVTLEDARSGRLWQATDARVILSNGDETLDMTVDFALFNGTEDLSDIALSFSSRKGSLATSMALSAQDLPARDFALQSPALAFLAPLDAPLSADMRLTLAPDGRLERYAGRLEIGAGNLAPDSGAPPLSFEAMSGYFDYDPQAGRLDFTEAMLRSDRLSARGRGQLILSDFAGNWPRAFTGQFALTDLAVDPGAPFEAPLAFERGAVDFQFALAPFRMDVGQFYLSDEALELRGAGHVAAVGQGWDAALDLKVPALTQEQVMGFWPPALLPKPRAWFDQNMLAAQYSDLRLALRRAPEDARPRLFAQWNFEGLRLITLAAQPPLTEAKGYATVQDNRLDLTLEGGQIVPPQGGAVDVTGSHVMIPDLSKVPADLALDITADASAEALLAIMAAKPFNALRDSPFGPDVVDGRAALSTQISFPLKARVLPQDVTYRAQARLSDVTSDTLVPGLAFAAAALDVTADPDGMDIRGPVRLGSATGEGVWRKAFGPEARGISDLTARVDLDQAFLDTFNIALPDGAMAGRASGGLEIAFRPNTPPAFRLTSALTGATLALPDLAWRKPAGEAGQLTVTGTAGPRPTVDLLEVAASGLSASGGSLRLSDNGALESLRFERVQLDDWLDTAVTLTGQGAGQPLAIAAEGGRVDLRRAPFGAGEQSGASGEGGPLTLDLEELRITESLRLAPFRARLSRESGLRGDFTGQLNGQAPLSGLLTPSTHGPKISISAEDAGRVVTA